MFLEKLLILLQIKNINKFILFFVFFLCSCSNFDFVYNNNKTGSKLSIDEIFVSGSGDDIIKKILSNKDNFVIVESLENISNLKKITPNQKRIAVNA